MNEENRKISEERQMVYYIGMGMVAIGFLLFISTFFTGFSMMSNTGRSSFPSDFQQHFSKQRSQMNQFASQSQSAGFRALFGILFIIAGGLCMKVGASGLAGSGVILDPQQAREDLEPYSRMAGGMVKDALDETGIQLTPNSPSSSPQTVIKVRCHQCQALNDEDARFCDQCGAAM